MFFGVVFTLASDCGHKVTANFLFSEENADNFEFLSERNSLKRVERPNFIRFFPFEKISSMQNGRNAQSRCTLCAEALHKVCRVSAQVVQRLCTLRANHWAKWCKSSALVVLLISTTSAEEKWMNF